MKSVHFLGIAGSGTSAVAHIAEAQGYKVTGCDKNLENEFTTNFEKSQLFLGHNPNHLDNIDILAITPAVLSLDPDNKEIQRAKEKGIEVISWQEFMGKYLEKDRFVIAVCGTHGKSTTTAMAATLLEDAKLDPTLELGAILPNSGKNYRVGESKYFITEADEFNDNFLVSHPDIAIVTTIEMDHPEYFKDFGSYKDSFYKFLLQTKSLIIANLSDPNIAEIVKTVMKHSSLTVIDYSKNELNLNLKVPGTHNQLNASAVFQLGLALDIPAEKIRQSLENFSGISRRFEYVGTFKGALTYSDFGHHPTEIKATIQAAREKFPDKKLKLIFEPHMFSRTKALFDDFVKVFKKLPIDQGVIIDIYPSREVDTGQVRSYQLAESINLPHISYKNPEELREYLDKNIQRGDIVFFMGAGDIDSLARKLAKNAE